ncbi:hypothetical protein CHE218_21590 [Microbacterium sp. che218]
MRWCPKISIAVAQRSPVSEGRFRTWAKGADAATRAVATGAVMVVMVTASSVVETRAMIRSSTTPVEPT